MLKSGTQGPLVLSSKGKNQRPLGFLFGLTLTEWTYPCFLVMVNGAAQTSYPLTGGSPR